jgi:hypothetical protein
MIDQKEKRKGVNRNNYLKLKNNGMIRVSIDIPKDVYGDYKDVSATSDSHASVKSVLEKIITDVHYMAYCDKGVSTE